MYHAETTQISKQPTYYGSVYHGSVKWPCIRTNTDRNTTFTFVPAPPGTIRATAAAHRSPPSERFSGLHIATYRPSDHAGSAVGLHDCFYRGAKLATLNSASNSLSSSTSGVVQPSAQQSAQQHLPGVTSLVPDPSLPPVDNGGQQQIPSSLDFSLSSSQQDLNLGTPEDAALLHTNYRVPSIASHLSNSCIAAITNGEYVDLASLLPFSSLLRDHVTANSQLKLQVGNEGLTIPLPSQAKRPKITGIERWLEAFAIYSSVLLSSYPSRGVDLFAYQQLIRESARTFPGMAWYLYDMEFRRRASHNLSINWGQRDVQLYLDTLLASQKPYLVRPAAARIM